MYIYTTAQSNIWLALWLRLNQSLERMFSHHFYSYGVVGWILSKVFLKYAYIYNLNFLMVTCVSNKTKKNHFKFFHIDDKSKQFTWHRRTNVNAKTYFQSKLLLASNIFISRLHRLYTNLKRRMLKDKIDFIYIIIWLYCIQMYSLI